MQMLSSSFLPLNASQNSTWMDRAFGEPAKWCWLHGCHQPLAQEILQASPGMQTHWAGVSRHMVVNIAVRGKDLVSRNNRTAVTLAFGAR